MNSATGSTVPYRKIAGLHVLRLQGSASERAAQHGALLRNEIQHGAMQALARKNEWLIRNAPGLMQYRAFQEPAVWLYKRLLLPWLVRQNACDADRLRAIAEAADVPYERCSEGALQPDALMLLSRLSLMKYLLKEIPSSGLPGCTSAVTLRDWTRTGDMLVCRNLDYPIVGPWEANTTISFNYPSGSGEIPHVSVATAGVPLSGLTSMNREGLTIATHAHFGREVSLAGRSIVSIGDEIISRARTIGEAVDIALRNRRIGNWSFVISSARERNAAVIEMTPTRTRVRFPEDGFLAHTNYFQTELRDKEGLVSGGSYADMVGRVRRIRQILESRRGDLTAPDLVHALGDHVDPETGEERVVGNIVSVVTTIGSTVFEPNALRLWISNRNESPTGLGEFIGIDFEHFWDRPDEARPDRIAGYQPRSPKLIEGAKRYREAYREWHMESHVPGFRERTLSALEKTLETFPSDGCIWVQAGIVAFSLRRFDEARSYFEQAGSRPLGVHVSHVRDLFLARCRDLSGDRKTALSLYQRYTRITDPKLRKAMRDGLRRRYRAADTIRLMVDLQFADVLQY